MSLPVSTLVHTECEPVEVSLKDKLAFLEHAFPSPSEAPPECIDTHASYGFLNRELAGTVYRGGVPLVERPDGGLALGGEGKVVDWLVEMVPLPAALMLDYRLKAGPVPQLSEIVSLGSHLVSFFRKQQSKVDMGHRFSRHPLRDKRINAAHFHEMQHHLSRPLRAEVLDFDVLTIDSRRGEIMARDCQSFLSEGHGDLRAQHICLTDPPVVFDRVELDHNLRLADPFLEFNGLGIECAFGGAGWVRAVMLFWLSQTILPTKLHLADHLWRCHLPDPCTVGQRSPARCRGTDACQVAGRGEALSERSGDNDRKSRDRLNRPSLPRHRAVPRRKANVKRSASQIAR